MKRAWIAALAVAALAMPGTAFADGNGSGQSPTQNASKLCKALRAQNPGLFRTTYGRNQNGRNAHGKCVSSQRHAVRQLIAQAVSECKTELAAQSSDNPNHPNQGNDKAGQGADKRALRECVRKKLRTLLAERRADIVNAARQCKAERASNQAKFAEKYGKNENDRNAFGKCVSQTVRENQTEPTS